MPKIADEDFAEIYGDTETSDAMVFGGNSIDGYFFAPYANELQIAGNQPSFRCSAAAAAAVLKNSVGTYNGTSYTVTSKQPTRAGDVLLMLRLT